MTRQQIAATLRDVLSDEVVVYAAPPSALAAPCVVIKLDAATQLGPCIWSQTYTITVVGPGGDNEAALTALEDLLYLVGDKLSRDYAQGMDWEAPGTITSGGQTYLAANLQVTLEHVYSPPARVKEASHAS